MAQIRWDFMLAGVLIGVLAFIGLPATHAANAVVGNGTAASCTEAAFNQALATVNQSQNGTITFNCGGVATIPITSQKEFTANGTYILDGNNQITLDAGNASRIIYLAPGRNITLTVKGLSLVNGRAATYGDENYGGAIYVGHDNTHVIVEESTLSGNSSTGTTYGGGAIYIHRGKLTIRDSTISQNTGNIGGGIYSLVSESLIENSIISGNVSVSDHPSGGGGGLYSDASKITISDSEITQNSSAGKGGGIFNFGGAPNLGSDSIVDSLISENESKWGGGIHNGGDTLEITNSTIANNNSELIAGGIWNSALGTVLITNSTISGNTTDQAGGGIYQNDESNAILTNVTMTNNLSNNGSAIRTDGSALVLANSIIANNPLANNANNPQCSGFVTDGGNNLQYPLGKGACTATAFIADPLLGNLTDNGGPTPTHALPQNSPAVNAGACIADTDQRGVTRPQAGIQCDIGAFELEAANNNGGGGPIGVVPLAPQNIQVSGSSFRPTIVWQNDERAQWYNVWIVRQLNGNYQQLHLEWYPKNPNDEMRPGVNLPSVQCQGLTCTLRPRINPSAGTYQIYMQAWGNGHFSNGGISGAQSWNGPTAFTVLGERPTAALPLTSTVQSNGELTLRWNASAGATWYHVWVGSSDYSRVLFYDWVDAEDMNCLNGGVCTLGKGVKSLLGAYDIRLGSGVYRYYVRSWGPGGFSTGGISSAPEWAQSPDIEGP